MVSVMPPGAISYDEIRSQMTNQDRIEEEISRREIQDNPLLRRPNVDRRGSPARLLEESQNQNNQGGTPWGAIAALAVVTTLMAVTIGYFAGKR